MNKVSQPLSLPAPPQKNTNNLYTGTMTFINLFHQQYTSFRGSYTLWLPTSRLLAFYISFFLTQILLNEWLLWWHSFAKRCLLTAVQFEVRESRNLTRLWIQTSRLIPLNHFLQKCHTKMWHAAGLPQQSQLDTYLQLHILQLVCLDVWWDSTTWQKFYSFSSFQDKIGIN